MIVHLAFNAEYHLIESHFSGILTEADVKMYYSFVKCSVPTGRPYHELIDYTEVEDHQLSTVLLADAADAEVSKSGVRDSQCKTAFVVRAAPILKMLETYFQISGDLMRSSRIFTDTKAATTWLTQDELPQALSG